MEAIMAENQDIREATATYSGFLSLLKWGTIVSILVTALVVLIIA
jgi:tetrahydromethanopterin S-methyltransferase subunit B